MSRYTVQSQAFSLLRVGIRSGRLSITHKSVDGFAKPYANGEKPGFATARLAPLERISTGQTCQTRRTLAKDLWVMDRFR